MSMGAVAAWGASRRAQRQSLQSPQAAPQAIVIPIPPPYGGLNASAPLAAMPPQDASIMDNYFSSPGGVVLRNGSVQHTTGGMGGLPVQMLTEWAGPSSTKMIAAANGNIYDCTTFNASASSLASGYGSNQWQTVMFRQKVHLANGVDAPQSYDGTVIAAPAWSGVTLTTLSNVNIYRSRVYFVQKNTLSIWYGGVDASSGALTQFDMQSIFQRGGYLLYMATWTRDSGNGMNDLAVFVSSQGEILVYQGGYPADSTWSLIGRYTTLIPLGNKAVSNYGAELLIGTVGGLIPMSAIIQYGPQAQLAQALTFKINPLISQAAMLYSGNFGWQVKVYPVGNYLLINVPVSDATGSITSWQYVLNIYNGAWCRFLGQNAPVWAIHNGLLYFGTGDGRVAQADYGTSDLSTGTTKTNGTAITGNIKTAFQDYGFPGQIKQFTNVMPLIGTNGTVALGLALSVDYQDQAITGTLSVNQSGSPWNTSPWNTTPWGDQVNVNIGWYGIAGVGHVGALRLNTMTTSNSINVEGFNMMFFPGGVI